MDISNYVRSSWWILIALALFAGCGGGGSHSSSTSNATPQTVEGIATPSNVSVVTATNAD